MHTLANSEDPDERPHYVKVYMFGKTKTNNLQREKKNLGGNL